MYQDELLVYFFSTDWAVWFPEQLMMRIFSPDKREHGTAVTAWLGLSSLVPGKTRRTKLLSLSLLPMTQMRLKELTVIVLVVGSWGDKGVVIETPRDDNSNFVFSHSNLNFWIGFLVWFGLGTTSLSLCFSEQGRYSSRSFHISCNLVSPLNCG